MRESQNFTFASLRCFAASEAPQPGPRYLLLIQPTSACSPTQFAIKTKFRALKPEGRWVSSLGTCCLATGGWRVAEAGGGHT